MIIYMIKYHPYKSDKSTEKYYIIKNENKKVYFGHAGASDFTIHKDEERNALNLKEPYKSLPDELNNLSDVVDNLYFTTPLLKDTSNNITIDLSSYVLKTNFDSSFNIFHYILYSRK